MRKDSDETEVRGQGPEVRGQKAEVGFDRGGHFGRDILGRGAASCLGVGRVWSMKLTIFMLLVVGLAVSAIGLSQNALDLAKELGIDL